MKYNISKLQSISFYRLLFFTISILLSFSFTSKGALAGENSQLTIKQLKDKNEKLWQQLEFDNLFEHYDDSTRVTTTFACPLDASYAKLIRTLQRKFSDSAQLTADKNFPVVDIILKDKHEGFFRLGAIPKEWLKYPEIVADIAQMHSWNSREKLEDLPNGIDLARELFNIIFRSGEDYNLCRSQLHSSKEKYESHFKQGGDFNRYCVVGQTAPYDDINVCDLMSAMLFAGFKDGASGLMLYLGCKLHQAYLFLPAID